jgi:hypothetical protein
METVMLFLADPLSCTWTRDTCLKDNQDGDILMSLKVDFDIHVS